MDTTGDRSYGPPPTEIGMDRKARAALWTRKRPVVLRSTESDQIVPPPTLRATALRIAVKLDVNLNGD